MAAPSVRLFRKVGSLYGRFCWESELSFANQRIFQGFAKSESHQRYASTINILTPQKVFLDTNAVVNNMEEAGFKKEQAECLTGILVTILSKEAELKNEDLVSKEQKEIMMQEILAHIASLRKDMIILEKSEFSSLKNENEKLQSEIQQVKLKLKDEIDNLRNNVTLDINLERGRSKESSAVHEQSIKNNDHRITTEVANMMAKLEATKNDLLKYFAGILLGSMGLGLGLYRVISR